MQIYIEFRKWSELKIEIKDFWVTLKKHLKTELIKDKKFLNINSDSNKMSKMHLKFNWLHQIQEKRNFQNIVEIYVFYGMK